ncbi:uncharacterized protein LOC112590187 isoform X2 [Harpegnathos saltator]|uniref:uncharacterized protein LOC112590187 isoform X2 n=1 Tax=Harpegnathos saltator TaxID=610380 RepID=UPI000DBEEAFF|nr:uncharacterized protein LOC112590187 isoform X2 [Harpegnathos saltator]XP_025161772.1 uncharacterized protein LOC112590187 isoform X2 [Harpegnathos saltator]
MCNMAEYLMWDLLHLENRVRMLQRRIERRVWSDTNDPFELHDNVFINLFRLPLDTVLELAEILRLSEGSTSCKRKVPHSTTSVYRCYRCNRLHLCIDSGTATSRRSLHQSLG